MEQDSKENKNEWSKLPPGFRVAAVCFVVSFFCVLGLNVFSISDVRKLEKQRDDLTEYINAQNRVILENETAVSGHLRIINEKFTDMNVNLKRELEEIKRELEEMKGKQ
jgi:hypothetical protein